MRVIEALLNKIYWSRPGLTSLSLRSHTITSEDYQDLVQFISRMPSLVHLDISDNDLPSLQLFALVEEVMQINQTRPPGYQLYLHTDFVVWHSAHPQVVHPRIHWVLTPEQWVKEHQTHTLFEEINHCPEIFDQVLPAFLPEFNYKNMMGLTPLICLAKSTYCTLLKHIAEKVGHMALAEHLIRDFSDPCISAAELDSIIPRVIDAVFINPSPHLEAAQKLQTHLLPNPSRGRSEALGYLAIAEKNYRAAYHHFEEAARLGCIFAHFRLVEMMLSEYLPPDLQLSPERLKEHLRIAAEHKILAAQLLYANQLFAEKNPRQAYTHYLDVSLTLRQAPHLKFYVAQLLTPEVNQHIHLSVTLSDLVKALISKRVQLAQDRYQQHPNRNTLPAFNYTNLKNILKNSLYQTCYDTIIERAHGVLYWSSQNKPNLFQHLREELFAKMDGHQINQGILSIEPQQFANSVCDEIYEFMLKSQGHAVVKTGKNIAESKV